MRAILAAVSLGLVVTMTATVARAQGAADRWWEFLPWFGNADASRYASDDKSRRNELDGLRPGSTPLRSEIMLEALEAAIRRFQRIVSNGGWRTIPGARMRPEDDEVRMPRLLQRLTITGELARRQSDGVDVDELGGSMPRCAAFNLGMAFASPGTLTHRRCKL